MPGFAGSECAGERRRRSLVPDFLFVRLLRGEDFDEPFAEGVEVVGAANVPVQTDRHELREHVDPIIPLLMQLESGMSIKRYLPASAPPASSDISSAATTVFRVRLPAPTRSFYS